jgi:hypothetical protein
MAISFTKLFHALSGLAIAALLTHNAFSQSRIPALDSMGMNMGRQNWKAALQWALKAAEAEPSQKNWRYLNAAEFASRDGNRELAIHYARLVVESDIAVRAGFNKSFAWLQDDPQWKALMDRIAVLREQERQNKIKASLPFRIAQRESLLRADQYVDSLSQIASADALYKKIRQDRPKRSYTATGRYAYAWIKLADTLQIPYLIQLPPHFDAEKEYPLIVVLHGAVLRQDKMADVPDSTQVFFGRMYMQQASESGYIAVFPYSNKKFNWMMPDDGFELVPELVRQVKHLYAVDDSRVYVTGHSNGATGAFSYLMKEPGLFAGFSGINNRPQVRTGGTFFRNALNRSFYNVATDYDYYFPFEGHRAITAMAHTLGVDWQNVEITGQRPHHYLINSSDSITQRVYGQIFADMSTRKRDPFQKRLYWECDDVKHGRSDWLEITQLDTLRRVETWHNPLNVEVNGWRVAETPGVVLDSTSNAFEFPRKSGAVQAIFTSNGFELKTSRVGKIRIYLSPEMIDFNKKLKVIINGRKVFDGLVAMDRSFLLAQYRKEMDHQSVWVNALEFDIPAN